jgi:hypothetical protein
MAQITTPSSGQSDMFLVMYNANSTSAGFNDSIVMSLGFSVDGTSPAAFNFSSPYSWTIDGSLTQLETDLGDTTTGDFQFAVVAGDELSNGTTTAGAKTGVEMDYTSATAPKAITSTGIGNAASTLASWLNANNTGTAPTFNSSGILVGTATNGAGWAAGTNPGSTTGQWGTLNGGSAQNANGPVSSPMEFYASNTIVPATRGGASTTTTDLLGTFSINFANDTLNWTPAVSAVPIPAAAWLLLSGLLGVAAIGRRRAGGANVGMAV